MNLLFIEVLVATAVALAASSLLMPALIAWSAKLRLVDMPNERKLHRKPIPSIGGLVMMLSLVITFFVYAPLQQMMEQYWPLAILMLLLTATGVLDDRLNLPAMLRLFIQMGSAFIMAYQDVRLHHLHGFLGVQEIPVVWQYILTIVIVTGVTNAFNLIDGIDGLAGGIALVNMLVFAVLFYVVGASEWLLLLMPFASVLTVFIKYNWRPARVFMGDGGSLVLGFLFSVLGIEALQKSFANTPDLSGTVLVTVTATMMLVAVDTLRVFYTRIKKGKSPFSADKNHLHHLFIRQHLSHVQATGRVVKCHTLLIAISLLLSSFLSVTVVILFQIVLVVGYIRILYLSMLFQRWFRFVKRMEAW